MAAPKKITKQELIAKIQDLDTSDEEIAQYLTVDLQQSNAFAPVVIPNPELIKDDGLEGAFALNVLNKFARLRRNAKYRRRIRNWDGVRVVAEGDSWFQYPLLLKDTIDHLADLDQFQYAIYGLSEAGDLLSDMVFVDEITQVIEQENPHVFLISGGGNDMVGDNRMATLVHKYSANRLPENYPNQKFDQFLTELEQLYRELFKKLLATCPHLKIICHGYDKAIPFDGPWLGKPLEMQDIKDKPLQRSIVAIMIERFNDRLAQIAGDFAGSVFHVDCQGLIGSRSKWHDELHPKNEGYFKVAQKFDETIKAALAVPSASAALAVEEIQVGTEVEQQQGQRLARVKKLGDKEFVDLVVSRAEAVMGKKITPPTTTVQRRELEAEISSYYEKIHKESNFLPSSFLEVGVDRAQAVCRISTRTSYGSGFLIGTRNFIMTNNHVLPSSDVARSSVAEFDYDEDDALYSVSLKPDTLFITDEELDFTIVACDSLALPETIAPIPLLGHTNMVTRGERVNIIQHPRGRKKEISIHDNKVNYVYDVTIRYTADTEGGSSGSPVFNNSWELVALHHAGWSHSDGSATNEGIRLASIVNYLQSLGSNEAAAVLTALDDPLAEDVAALPGRVHQPVGRVVRRAQQGAGQNAVTMNIGRGVGSVTITID